MSWSTAHTLPAAARRWASALRAALIAYDGPAELQAIGLRALDTIEDAIG